MSDGSNIQEPASARGDEGDCTFETPSGNGQLDVHRMSLEKAEAIADRVFAEHAELFRRLAL